MFPTSRISTTSRRAADDRRPIRRRHRALLLLLSGLLACPSAEQTDVAPEAPFAGRSQTLLSAPLETPVPGDEARAGELLGEALQLLRMRRLPPAAERLDQALEADPACLEALLQQGNLLLMPGSQREPTKALRAYRLARLVDPGNLAALLGEAYARTVLQDDAVARALFVELQQRLDAAALQLADPAAALMERGLGELAYRSLELDAALAHFDRAAKLAPGEPRVLFCRAEALEKLGRLDEAERQLQECIDGRADEPRYHFARARLLQRLGRAGEAARERRIYELLVPFTDDLSRQFAGDHERRIALRQELAEIFPEFPRAPFLLAQERLAAGQFGAVAESMRQHLVERPDDPEAFYLLAQALAREGKRDEAKQVAERMRAAGAPEAAVQSLLSEIEQ